MMSTPASSSMARTSRLPSSMSNVPAPSTSRLGINPSFRELFPEQRRGFLGGPPDHLDQPLSFATYAPGRGGESDRPFHPAPLALDRRRHAAQVLRELL